MIALVTGGAHVRTDVRSYEDNERLVAAAVERFGHLDIAVFNAGAAGPRSFSVEGYRDAMRINLDAVVYGLGTCREECTAAR